MTQTYPTPSAEAADADVEEHNRRLDEILRDVAFESMPAAQMLRWATSAFAADRVVLNTSLQYTGVAMIHMAVDAGLRLRVATIDTLRLHPETYAFLRQVEARYGIEIEVHRPDPEQVRGMVRRFGEYLFFDSKTLQEYCCHLRKVKPNDELLKTVDCWIAGVRRDQSGLRSQTPKATTVTEYGSRRRILKLNPMADWSQERLLSFLAENDVPRHPLYAQGYESIGCFICSTPTRPGEDQRAGRWRWFNGEEHPDPQEAKECGLHVPIYNI